MFGQGALAHVEGENDEARSWFGIGQSIRNLIAGFVQAFPEDASKLGDPDRAADAAITNIVSNYFTMLGSRNPMAEEAARQCGLGNRAAC